MTDQIQSIQQIDVGDIHVQLEDKKLLFSPTDDISGREVCLVLQMFLNLLSRQQGVTINLDAFIQKHNLSRHFTEIEAVQPTEEIK